MTRPTNDVKALESSVEQTRQDIADTITAIQSKMQPTQLLSDTRDALVGGAQNAVTGAENAVRDLLRAVQDHLPNTPLAAATIGAVVAWLGTLGQNAQHAGSSAAATAQSTADTVHSAANAALTQASATTDQLANSVRDRVSQAASDLSANASDAVTRAQSQIGAEFAQLEQLIGKNPWLVGALALGIGIAIGVALPETEPEHALYGQARDALGQQVQGAVHGVLGALSPLTHPPAATPEPPPTTQV